MLPSFCNEFTFHGNIVKNTINPTVAIASVHRNRAEQNKHFKPVRFYFHRKRNNRPVTFQMVYTATLFVIFLGKAANEQSLFTKVPSSLSLATPSGRVHPLAL
jgi:peptidoglycan/LPS O-acetylase OafA/YrhL